jgi:hypothetical protein
MVFLLIQEIKESAKCLQSAEFRVFCLQQSKRLESSTAQGVALPERMFLTTMGRFSLSIDRIEKKTFIGLKTSYSDRLLLLSPDKLCENKRPNVLFWIPDPNVSDRVSDIVSTDICLDT